MKTRIVLVGLLAGIVTSAGAQEITWRKDIAPIVAAKCGECHGANAPEYSDWMQLGEEKRRTVAPRMDTYPYFMSYVIWPATGAMMRRLDDGSAAGGKPGNMYRFLGDSDGDRAKNLATIKTWLGDGAWNTNRWGARGNTPGVTKEQLDKVKAKY
ncbi:MAG TPA: cytochrome C [Burkholderiales bacterium]|nr:cytochrome C [Burkholderiales bacterium]